MGVFREGSEMRMVEFGDEAEEEGWSKRPLIHGYA